MERSTIPSLKRMLARPSDTVHVSLLGRHTTCVVEGLEKGPQGTQFGEVEARAALLGQHSRAP